MQRGCVNRWAPWLVAWLYHRSHWLTTPTTAFTGGVFFKDCGNMYLHLALNAYSVKGSIIRNTKCGVTVLFSTSVLMQVKYWQENWESYKIKNWASLLTHNCFFFAFIIYCFFVFTKETCAYWICQCSWHLKNKKTKQQVSQKQTYLNGGKQRQTFTFC